MKKFDKNSNKDLKKNLSQISFCEQIRTKYFLFIYF